MNIAVRHSMRRSFRLLMARSVKSHYSQFGTREQGEDDAPHRRKTAYAAAFNRR
jgi:hypothetical protein